MKNSLSVIFDMDGVIVNSNPYHLKALHVFFEQYGISIPTEKIKNDLFGRTNDDWIRRVFGDDISDERVQELAREKEKIFREMYEDDIKPLNGLPEFIKALEKENVPMAVATSAPKENLDFVLKKTGFEGHFNAMLYDSDAEKGKPDPQIYLRALERLGASAEKTVVFEDSLNGIKAASSAGCKVIGVTTAHPADELTEPDMVIDDFTGVTVEKLRGLLGS